MTRFIRMAFRREFKRFETVFLKKTYQADNGNVIEKTVLILSDITATEPP